MLQIQAVLGDRNKPIVIVGTHADEVLKQKQDPTKKMKKVIDILKNNTEILHGADILYTP